MVARGPAGADLRSLLGEVPRAAKEDVAADRVGLSSRLGALSRRARSSVWILKRRRSPRSNRDSMNEWDRGVERSSGALRAASRVREGWSGGRVDGRLRTLTPGVATGGLVSACWLARLPTACVAGYGARPAGAASGTSRWRAAPAPARGRAWRHARPQAAGGRCRASIAAAPSVIGCRAIASAASERLPSALNGHGMFIVCPHGRSGPSILPAPDAISVQSVPQHWSVYGGAGAVIGPRIGCELIPEAVETRRCRRCIASSQSPAETRSRRPSCRPPALAASALGLVQTLLEEAARWTIVLQSMPRLGAVRHMAPAQFSVT